MDGLDLICVDKDSNRPLLGLKSKQSIVKMNGRIDHLAPLPSMLGSIPGPGIECDRDRV